MLEEDQAKRNVLVVGRLHIAAQLIGSLEEICLEAKIAAIAIGTSRLGAGGDRRGFLGFSFNRATKRDRTAATTPRRHDAFYDEFILHRIVGGFFPLQGFAQRPLPAEPPRSVNAATNSSFCA